MTPSKKLKESPGKIGIKKKFERILSSKPVSLKAIEAISNVHNGSDTQTHLC